MNKSKQILALITITVVLIMIGVFLVSRPPVDGSSVDTNYDCVNSLVLSNEVEQPLCVEIAATPSQLTRGLSGRDSIGEDQAMVFKFEDSNLHGIWMKDMRFDIDIIWLDDQGCVADVKAGAKPDSYPEIFHPSQPATYVVETAAGYAVTHNISLDDCASGSVL